MAKFTNPGCFKLNFTPVGLVLRSEEIMGLNLIPFKQRISVTKHNFVNKAVAGREIKEEGTTAWGTNP